MPIIFTKGKPKAQTPVQPIAPTPAPTPVPAPVTVKSGVKGGGVKVLKFGAAKPVAGPVEPLPSPAPDTATTGFPVKSAVGPSEAYEPLHIGQRVIIRKTSYNVKHYAVGDIGEVKSILGNNDPLNINHAGYRYHIVTITEPLDKARKGQTGALFRHEIEPAPPKVQK